MLTHALVLVADEPYLPHAKSLLVNCRRQGQWDGECCLILPPSIDATDFTARGIHVLHNAEPKHYRKFAIMDKFFSKWELMLYLDCDTMVQAPLAPLLYELEWGTLLADREPFNIRHAFTHWASEEQLKRPESIALLDELWDQSDPEAHQFNTGILLWHPGCMPERGQERLLALRDKLAPVNTHCISGTDQPIFNLVYQGRFRQVRSTLFGYWRNVWDQSIVVHTVSFYAPWIKPPTNHQAYMNEKLGRPYHEVYQENLRLFDETFPRK